MSVHCTVYAEPFPLNAFVLLKCSLFLLYRWWCCLLLLPWLCIVACLRDYVVRFGLFFLFDDPHWFFCAAYAYCTSYACVSYIVERLVICDLIGSSNEQLHDSCVIFEFHFYHTIDVVSSSSSSFSSVFWPSVTRTFHLTFAQTLKNFEFISFSFFLHILSFHLLPLWNGELASIRNLSDNFFGNWKKKLQLEIKESICCFRTNILLYVCCILYFEWNCEITPKNFWSQPIWQIADSLFNFDISIN